MSTMWSTMVHTLLTSSFCWTLILLILLPSEPKDVEKQIIEMVKDLTCKYLHPQESETESSDEDFPESFTRPVNEQIFSEFPKGTLTDEMKMHIENAIEFMEQSHTAAANALKELKKTTPVIPHGPFRLLLQALCQLVIKLWGHHQASQERSTWRSHHLVHATEPSSKHELTRICQDSSCSPHVPHENWTWHQYIHQQHS